MEPGRGISAPRYFASRRLMWNNTRAVMEPRRTWVREPEIVRCCSPRSFSKRRGWIYHKGLETEGWDEGGMWEKKWRGRGTTTRSVKRARMKTKGWNGYGERGIKILEVREGRKNGRKLFLCEEICMYICVCVWMERGM